MFDLHLYRSLKQWLPVLVLAMLLPIGQLAWRCCDSAADVHASCTGGSNLPCDTSLACGMVCNAYRQLSISAAVAPAKQPIGDCRVLPDPVAALSEDFLDNTFLVNDAANFKRVASPIDIGSKIYLLTARLRI